MTRAPTLALVALAACSGTTRARPVMPACGAATQPGLHARALTWNGSGWGAVVADGATLFLREFNADGTMRGEALALLEERSTPPRSAVAWSDGAYYIVVAPRAGGLARVFRATSRATDGDAYALDEEASGELAMVARPGESRPAAVLLHDAVGVVLRLVARDGEPSAPKRCPTDVQPRTVVSWHDGFRALAVSADNSHVALVALDDDCVEQWRLPLWQGELNGHAGSLAVDGDGTVAAFDDREGSAWIAAADHGGTLRVRATRMEQHARAPQVFVQTRADGRRMGIQVVAVRAIETGDRLETWRLGPDGLLREVRELAASPGLDVLTSAADPWGGGLVVYTREETAHDSARTGAGAIGFFSRVCP